jgi:hypothetical protein
MISCLFFLFYVPVRRHSCCCSLDGDCSENEEYMELNCAASCRVCNIVLPDPDRCYYVESGPDIWKPGDLHQMFRRILNDMQHQDQYTVEILSSPDIVNVTSSQDGAATKDGPWIVTIDNFLHSSELERLIELGPMEGYHRSEIYDKELNDDTYRTSSNSWCRSDSCAQDPVAKRVLQRIYDMIQIPEEYSEDMQMLYYQPGQ